MSEESTQATMKDWQQRVVDEEKDLSQKIDRLYAFVEKYEAWVYGDHDIVVSPEDLRILRLQGAVMSLYRQVLRERIETF